MIVKPYGALNHINDIIKKVFNRDYESCTASIISFFWSIKNDWYFNYRRFFKTVKFTKQTKKKRSETENDKGII